MKEKIIMLLITALAFLLIALIDINLIATVGLILILFTSATMAYKKLMIK